MSYTYEHGAGTEANPYQIWTAADLDGIRHNNEAHFIQMANIDLVGYANWVPLVLYAGSYDGNNFKIENLTVNSASNLAGLFGYVGWQSIILIKNVKLENVNVTGANNTGGLIGGGDALISNCSVTGTVTGNNWVGGLIGGLGSDNTGTVSECSFHGSVIGNASVGGLIGRMLDYGSVQNSYAVGTVYGTSGALGGLVGITWTSVQKCYAACVVSGSWGGGLIGENFGAVSGSYFDSSISGVTEWDTGVGTPKTTFEMKNQSTFVDWDFVNTWDIGTLNDGYPYLQWEVIDKTSLEQKINQGSAISPKSQELIDAIESGQLILNDDKATQQEVDAAVSVIEQALTHYEELIKYEAILGPSVFGVVNRHKRLRRVYLIVSKSTTSTMFVSVSNSEEGEFGETKQVLAGELDMHKIAIPIKQGQDNSGYCLRIKVSGVGKARVDDIVVEVVPRG